MIDASPQNRAIQDIDPSFGGDQSPSLVNAINEDYSLYQQ